MISERYQCCFVAALIPFGMGKINRERWAFFVMSPCITVHIYLLIDPSLFSFCYTLYLPISVSPLALWVFLNVGLGSLASVSHFLKHSKSRKIAKRAATSFCHINIWRSLCVWIKKNVTDVTVCTVQQPLDNIITCEFHIPFWSLSTPCPAQWVLLVGLLSHLLEKIY